MPQHLHVQRNNFLLLLLLCASENFPLPTEISCNSFFRFSFLFSPQMVLPNLTTNTIYEVKVRAASISTINPRQIILGSYSEPRKVNICLSFFMQFFFFESTIISECRKKTSFPTTKQRKTVSKKMDNLNCATMRLKRFTLVSLFLRFFYNHNNGHIIWMRRRCC